MALTVESVASGGLPYRVVGSQREVQKVVTFDNSYASEGESLPVSELGLIVLDSLPSCEVIAGTESSTLRAVTAYYTTADNKIHLIDSATGKEVEGTKDMSKVKVLVTARGK